MEALIAADIIQEGSEHDGMDDAYNTALLFAKMETEEDFRLNELYEAARYRVTKTFTRRRNRREQKRRAKRGSKNSDK